MKPCRIQASGPADLVPAPAQVIRLHRGTAARREDEPVILPIRPRLRSLGPLPLLMSPQRFHAHLGKRHRPRGVLGLRRDQAQGAADPLESMDDLQLGLVQVDISPAESQQFPAA